VQGTVELQAKVAQIASQLQHYTPNWHLLRKLDDQSRRYLEGDNQAYYFKWLALAVKSIQPRNVVELGTCTGASALMMYGELPVNSTLVSIDIQRNHLFIPPEVYEDPRVSFLIGNDLDSAIIKKVPDQVDFLFIDTEHTYRQVSKEWRAYRKKLSSVALVALDDIKLNDMPEFWKRLSCEKTDLTELCHASGFGYFICDSNKPPAPAELTGFWDRVRDRISDRLV
jgi:predicted O-methyltransferase YrrM